MRGAVSMAMVFIPSVLAVRRVVSPLHSANPQPGPVSRIRAEEHL